MTQRITPPGFVRMGDGRLVPAQAGFGRVVTKKEKKFLLVLQYYNGDIEQVEEQASLICDLEKVRNREVDVMLFRRADAREIGKHVTDKLKSKFGEVMSVKCRRVDAKGWPYGPNQMWSDLIMLMASAPALRDGYYAFLPLEADVVPTRPGWIGELIAEWKQAMARGKAIVGYVHDNPVPHVNGVAVYAADVYKRGGSITLAGGSPQIPYDVRHAKTLLPMTQPTPLIHFKWQMPTVTAAEVFAERNGVQPALFHGVKDGSARAAVKARHVTFTDRAPVAAQPKMITVDEAADVPPSVYKTGQSPAEDVKIITQSSPKDNDVAFGTEIAPSPQPPAKRPNVYTYVCRQGKPSNEDTRILEFWRKGWTAAGFNPIVLKLTHAASHPKFDDVQNAIERLPRVGNARDVVNGFNRWLALDMQEGGLMVDVTTLPDGLTPADVSEVSQAYLDEDADEGKGFLGAFLSKGDAEQVVQAILAVDFNAADPRHYFNGKPHVSDAVVVGSRIPYGPTKLRPLAVTGTGGPQVSVAMEQFLNGGTK